MTLLGLGIANKLSLLSKITLLPFGRDVTKTFDSDATNLHETNTNLALTLMTNFGKKITRQKEKTDSTLLRRCFVDASSMSRRLRRVSGGATREHVFN